MRGREDQIGRDQRTGAIACVTDLDLAYGLPAEKIVTVGKPDQAAARQRRCRRQGKRRTESGQPFHGLANFAPVSRLVPTRVMPGAAC